ncbi:phospho-sugar mutase [Desulfospira joergensenii]|uniref:phospho-sugar mutase n=1 Tax=Desulfospira joergensenii TaxID=53329 RepID=UPI0003B45B6A|nr:phospho-sugar mutase [Desulfospira joergensenii]
MDSADKFLSKARKGFNGIKVSDSQKESALKWLELWLKEDAFIDYVPQIHYLIDREEWDFLIDSFYQIIPFGTGGRRGPVGIGPNRINIWTVQSSAQGHSQYLIKKYGEEAKTRGIVLAYDVRCFTDVSVYNAQIPNPVMNLDGKGLAMAAAEVYAANGISVFLFEGIRSTPELSFSIRHLKAVAGALFSASHNLPTDNGKKVYDNFGGQLIPPDDQILVDEVTHKIKDILRIAYEDALDQGLVSLVGEEIDAAYQKAAASVSLSGARSARVIFSPLHGTGITSVYPVLKNLGFEVMLDPKTENMSGGFENVTFNIPNPEIEASFDTALAFAGVVEADIILNTDPDADRIGVMARHKGEWKFLNGNEIGILLTQFAISKYREKQILGRDNLIVETIVTSSLIKKIAEENGIQCVNDLLVGFKYIGSLMNELEEKGRMDDFILGTEESHGYIAGNYCRDKDASCAAVWVCELASELKDEGKTLYGYLGEIYSQYGYCHNYLTEIRLLGAKGMEQIQGIMDHLRETRIDSFGSFQVLDKKDHWEGEPQPHLSLTNTISRNVLVYGLKAPEDGVSIKVTVRPSGTEPKIKMYFEVISRPAGPGGLNQTKAKTVELKDRIEKDFMKYCYRLLGADFPDRGFLLFWQLPFIDKLKYFEIEKDIVGLRGIENPEERKNRLYELLGFLGSNPVDKIDPAFKAKFETGILEYLGIQTGS